MRLGSPADAQTDLVAGEFDAQRGQYVYRAPARRELPIEVSCIVGDALHNLRAALDYLAWELVAANGGTGSNRTSFPIFWTEKRFRQDSPQQIGSIDPRAQALIEGLQPYRGPDPETHPLTLLARLEHANKHRTLNLVEQLSASSFVGGCENLASTIVLLQSYEPGAEVAWITPPDADAKVDMYLVVAHLVAFASDGPGQGRPLLQTLRMLQEHVEAIPPLFHDFL